MEVKQGERANAFFFVVVVEVSFIRLYSSLACFIPFLSPQAAVY